MQRLAVILGLCAMFVNPLMTYSAHRLNNYKVTGKVIFNKDQTKKGATVYVLTDRPMAGRIPFTHADQDGNFEITFKDIPGKYAVYAHEGETNGLFPVFATPEAAKASKMKHGSKFIEFPDADAEESVTITLE